MRRVALAGALLLALLLAGCIGSGGDDAAGSAADEGAQALTPDRAEEARQAASDVPQNYTLPRQDVLEPRRVWFNDSVGVEAAAGVEGNGDEGGTDYNGQVVTTDVSRHLPPGQPAEIRIQLSWDPEPGQSADLEIVTDLPGHRTDTSSGDGQLNWNLGVQSMTVNTVGVEGEDHVVGVEAHNGRNPRGEIEFSMRLEFHYPEDVLTPHHPYAFTVPANATGVVLESVKTAGDEHIRSSFVIVGPDDTLVDKIDYNDLAIASESIFVPLAEAGEHVFYAYNMSGGFLSLEADTGVEDRTVRPLPLVRTTATDVEGPAPGTVARDWTGSGPATPMTGGQETSFTVEDSFPLRIEGSYEGRSTGATQIRISSPAGLVYDHQRVLHHEDERGSLGYTDDEANTVFRPGNLRTGSYTVHVVNNAPGSVTHTVTTYER